jgi:hypothetical protein
MHHLERGQALAEERIRTLTRPGAVLERLRRQQDRGQRVLVDRGEVEHAEARVDRLTSERVRIGKGALRVDCAEVITQRRGIARSELVVQLAAHSSFPR